MTALTFDVVLYQLDHLSARFRHEQTVALAPENIEMRLVDDHARVGIDLPLRDWITLGRPSTVTLTIDNAAASAAPQYKADDPDPTPELAKYEDYCRARGREHGSSCTWQAGHDGPHVAGNGEIIIETWEQ